MMTQAEEVAYLIKEKAGEGMTGEELGEFFPDLKPNSISAILSNLYAGGDFRRKRVPGSRQFRYFYEEGAKPEAMERNRKARTSPAVEHNLEQAQARIAELEAWQAEAIKRFPDLAVAEVVLRARKIVASKLSAQNDARGAAETMKGCRDETLVMQSVIAALEE